MRVRGKKRGVSWLVRCDCESGMEGGGDSRNVKNGGRNDIDKDLKIREGVTF